MIKQLKKLIKKNRFLYSTYLIYLRPKWHGRWILGRHACLGREIIERTDNNLPIYNIQKGRVDLLLAIKNNPNLAPHTKIVSKYLNRDDMLDIVRQQEYSGFLPKGAPSLVFMDSFSELVDQLFVHKKNGWRWCSYYSDIKTDEEFGEIFNNEGLINLENLELNYRKYFNFIRKKYGEVPIIFIHFPVSLELREIFRIRAAMILNIIERLTKEYGNLYSINVDEKIVDFPNSASEELKNFPYHYNDITYTEFVKKFKDLASQKKIFLT